MIECSLPADWLAGSEFAWPRGVCDKQSPEEYAAEAEGVKTAKAKEEDPRSEEEKAAEREEELKMLLQRAKQQVSGCASRLDGSECAAWVSATSGWVHGVRAWADAYACTTGRFTAFGSSTCAHRDPLVTPLVTPW